MHFIHAVKKDEEGRDQEGVRFWWSEGESLYLYQRWEHKASGPILDSVNPDPIYKGSLKTTVQQCWGSYEIIFETENYSG